MLSLPAASVPPSEIEESRWAHDRLRAARKFRSKRPGHLTALAEQKGEQAAKAAREAVRATWVIHG
jgi:hypothetical protein